MSSLSGRVVVVTGAGGAVGSALAFALAKEGALIAGLDRRPPKLPEETRTLSLAVDLTQEAEVEAAFERIEAELGPVWGLANIAGTWQGGTGLADTSLAVFESMVSINLRSCFLTSRAAARWMRAHGGGRVVSVSSLPALRGTGGANASAYVASKAGVTALMQVLAEEGKTQGIRANAVAPGTIRTPANEAAMPGADPSQWATLDDVAAALVFALSPACGVTGSVLPVPGQA